MVSKVTQSRILKPDNLVDPTHVRLFDKIAEELVHGDRQIFDTLSLHEQNLVISYLSDALVSEDVHTEFHNILWEMDFLRKPVLISEFLGDEHFLGRSCSDLHPKWAEDMSEVFAPGSPIFEWILTGAIGIGKGHPVDEVVATPAGWRRVGDLTVGDFVVGSDGSPTRVEAVYPRGVLPVYRVSFDDGSSVLVDGEHLWSVQTPSDRFRGRGWRTFSTSELVRRGVTSVRNPSQKKWHIPLVSPIQFEPCSVPLSLSPYAVGALIGDGGLCSEGIKISGADVSLIDDVAGELGLVAQHVNGYDYNLVAGPRGGRSTNEPLTVLRELGICVQSERKRIPSVYLRSSVQDRIELLRGLMDTDGGVQNGGKSSLFSTSSPGLADDVVELVQSLGGVASKNEKPTASLLNYIVDVRVPFNPFRLPRKAELWKPAEKYKPRRMIAAIVPEGSAEVRCIKVAAADSLYAARSYIVTHNTTIACAALAYKIYYLSCLRNPAQYYGLLPDSLIVFGIYSITKRQVNDAGYFKLRGYLDSSPYFWRDYPRSKKIDSKIVFQNQNVQVIPGSQELHALGLDLFSYLMDEVNFMRSKNDAETGKAKGQAYDLYNSTHARLLSRFMRPGGTIPGLMLLLSSRNSETSFLEGRVKKVQGQKTTHISDYPLWEVKPKHRFTMKKFQVEVGDRVARSRILREGDEPRQGAKVIAVPGEFRKTFEEDVDQALRDIAGVATFNLSPLVRDRQSVFDAYREHLVHPFNRETLVVGIEDDFRIEDAFLVQKVCKVKDSTWVPILNPTAPRFIHVDIGLTGDALGLGMAHHAGIVRNTVFDQDFGTTSEIVSPYIVVDLMLRVVAPLGSEVDLSKIRGFITYLSRLYPLCKVTFDGFQSADCIQILNRVGIETGKQSVDRTDEAYLSLRSAHFDRRIAMYQYDPYETEILDLERDIKSRKVDHPLKNRQGGKGSKDVSDGVAGATWLCINDHRAVGGGTPLEIDPAKYLKLSETPTSRLVSPAPQRKLDVPVDTKSKIQVGSAVLDWEGLRGNL